MGEDGAGRSAGEDDRKLGRTPDAFDAGDEVQLSLKDVLVEEKEGAERLVLRGSGDVAVNRQMAKEGAMWASPRVSGCCFPWKRMKRRIQST